ncbi:DUF2851 family protein [Tenacibaculum jejuense]|uniref:DUF2851 domain-containing protein n=1 Tax=Tenacibaculum jejuense TaxID=584609 RepID=A0A238U8S0_9FLAO|nr:DUF2851 family protein [Tenacibaculum jejuense]SNR14978.1 conserved protein of unknown function [Tenacibaculum jejuense]
MKENFLHYVWQYKLFNKLNLKLISGESLQILHSGLSNKNSGPDFFNAKAIIDKILWYGHIEIHVKSSDWYQHQHEEDKNYDAVILHVVYEHDVDIYMKGNKQISTLELKDFIDSSITEKYASIFQQQTNWISCEKEIHTINSFIYQNFTERLYLERLESKSKFIFTLLENTNYDFEAVLFQLLVKNFGLKVNGDTFLKLATSFDFSLIRKIGANEFQLSALLFGQAGFLNEIEESEYQNKLKKEYEYLKHKYQLNSLGKNEFQFFRMRPNNFPTIRLAQIATLYSSYRSLFSKLIHLENIDDFYELLSTGVNEFWEEHYTFLKSSKKNKKQLTKSFIDLLLINTILPLKFVYLKHRDEFEETNFFKLLESIQPEKNTIIQKFESLKISSKNALESQALLQLKTNYCNHKKCLSCSFGNTILRS